MTIFPFISFVHIKCLQNEVGIISVDLRFSFSLLHCAEIEAWPDLKSNQNIFYHKVNIELTTEHYIKQDQLVNIEILFHKMRIWLILWKNRYRYKQSESNLYILDAFSGTVMSICRYLRWITNSTTMKTRQFQGDLQHLSLD